MTVRRKEGIGLISIIGLDATLTPFLNVVQILSLISDELYIITGNRGSVANKFNLNGNIHLYLIRHEPWKNVFVKVTRFLYTQFIASFKLLRLSRKTDVWVFLGGWSLLPMVAAKLSRKVVIFVSTGSSAKSSESAHDFFAKAVTILEKGNFILADRIVLYSQNLIKEGNLTKYRRKISIAQRHFLDFDKFRIQKPLSERGNIVGYIGRLSEEKGIMNFVKSIPLVLENANNVLFFVGGDGQMNLKIKMYLDQNNLNTKVNMPGWIVHEELPISLNTLKLLVLPSFTEGLPNIVLEAMACGTPVLATAVGAVSDVVLDNVTGFILEDNSPESIARGVVKVLNHPNLEEIIKKARELVEKEYTYQAAVESYRNILFNRA